MSRPVALSGGGTFDVTAGTLTANGAITGSGGLTKTGGGTLVLGGTNTYSGTTTVNGGTLSVSADANLGAGGGLVLNGSTLQVTGTSFGGTSRPVQLGAGGGTINLLAAAESLNLSAGVGGSGALTVNGQGTLRLAANSAAAAVTVNGSLAVAGSMTASGATTVGGSLAVEPGGSYTTAALTTTGPGPQVTFAGATLNVTGSGGLTVGTGGLPSTALTGQTTLDVNGPTTITSGGGLSVFGGSFRSGGVVLQGGSLVMPGSDVDLALLGNLSGTGTVLGNVRHGNTITASGGPLTLGDANSATGFTLFGGTLAVGPNAVNLASSDKAKLGTSTTMAGGTLASFNGVLLGGGANGTTVDAGKTLSSSGASTVNGPFTNNGAVTVQTGTLTFNALVNGAGSFGGAGTVVFNGGYSPGNSPALVSLTNAAFGPFDTLTMELGGTARGSQYDAVAASGALDLGGTLQLQFVNGFTPAAGQSFDLLDWGTLSGTFAALNLPAPGPGLAWDTTQLYQSGVLTVTPVPEPGTLAMVGLAAAVGGWQLRRSARAARSRRAAGR